MTSCLFDLFQSQNSIAFSNFPFNSQLCLLDSEANTKNSNTLLNYILKIILSVAKLCYVCVEARTSFLSKHDCSTSMSHNHMLHTSKYISIPLQDLYFHILTNSFSLCNLSLICAPNHITNCALVPSLYIYFQIVLIEIHQCCSQTVIPKQ